jgi:hypothetical protein
MITYCFFVCFLSVCSASRMLCVFTHADQLIANTLCNDDGVVSKLEEIKEETKTAYHDVVGIFRTALRDHLSAISTNLARHSGVNIENSRELNITTWPVMLLPRSRSPLLPDALGIFASAERTKRDILRDIGVKMVDDIQEWLYETSTSMFDSEQSEVTEAIQRYVSGQLGPLCQQ